MRLEVLVMASLSQPLMPLLEASAGHPIMPPKPLFPNFPLLGFMSLVHESITYIFVIK